MNEGFVKAPNLPENAVKSLLIGEKYVNILGKILEMLGISVIPVPENPHIMPPLAFHADMSVCHLGGDLLTAAEGVYDVLKTRLPDGFRLVKAGKGQRAMYPWDVGLNVCIFGEKLMHNLKFTDPVVADETKTRGIEALNVKQGYTKCSVCVLTSKRIITSDKGIHETALRSGIVSLLISPGHIRLDGYDTGFLGGACGKLSANKIAFTGSLRAHPDEKRILSFIGDAGLEAVFLTDGEVFDIGSIIPILESKN